MFNIKDCSTPKKRRTENISNSVNNVNSVSFNSNDGDSMSDVKVESVCLSGNESNVELINSELSIESVYCNSTFLNNDESQGEEIREGRFQN